MIRKITVSLAIFFLAAAYTAVMPEADLNLPQLMDAANKFKLQKGRYPKTFGEFKAQIICSNGHDDVAVKPHGVRQRWDSKFCGQIYILSSPRRGVLSIEAIDKKNGEIKLISSMMKYEDFLRRIAR